MYQRINAQFIKGPPVMADHETVAEAVSDKYLILT